MAGTGHAVPWPSFCTQLRVGSSANLSSHRCRGLRRCVPHISGLLLAWWASVAQSQSTEVRQGNADHPSYTPVTIPRRIAKPAWEKHDQLKSENCPDFSCPAGKRPVQKNSTEYRVETPEWCPRSDWEEGYALDEDAYGFYQRAISKCCQIKYICLQMCGMPFNTCYNRYYKCALKQCGHARDVLTFQRNDSNIQNTEHWCMSLTMSNGLHWLTANQKKSHAGAPGLDTTCQGFKELQASVCDCVPQEQLEEHQKARVEGFLRIYAPQELDKKGRFKKKKMWKAYRGKRYDLMFDMVVAHSNTTVKELPAPQPFGRAPSQASEDLLMGRMPKTLQKKLEAAKDPTDLLPPTRPPQLAIDSNDSHGAGAISSTDKYDHLADHMPGRPDLMGMERLEAYQKKLMEENPIDPSKLRHPMLAKPDRQQQAPRLDSISAEL